MTGLVVDASLVATALTDSGGQGDHVRARLRGTTLHAPHLVDAEVGSVLRRMVAAELMAAEQAVAAVRVLGPLVAERYAHGPVMAGAWDLRHDLSFYDALCVALAARLGHPLLTADARLARTPGLPCAVEVIS